MLLASFNVVQQAFPAHQMIVLGAVATVRRVDFHAGPARHASGCLQRCGLVAHAQLGPTLKPTQQ